MVVRLYKVTPSYGFMSNERTQRADTERTVLVKLETAVHGNLREQLGRAASSVVLGADKVTNHGRAGGELTNQITSTLSYLALVGDA